MSGFFDSLFGKKQSPQPAGKPSPPVPPTQPPAKPSAAYQKGDVIGGIYEVRGELGKGGFGIVYLVLNRQSQRLCALKTFKDEFLADAVTRAGFKKEVLMWVNLGQHPNIVSARWVSELSGRLFVEMDYIAPDARGCVTLADHLKKAGGPLPIEQVLRWAAQFCAGMAHAYSHGIQCHRDIKPGNILIASDGTLKVSDFGLAVAAEAALQTGDGEKHSKSPNGIGGFSIWQSGGKGRCGTPGYMAPEVYRGEGAGIASDLYSFGLVLWQMAAGSLSLPFNVPYRGDIEAYMAAMYQQQITGRIPPVHEKLDTTISTLLNVDPAEREILTIDEWQAELEALCEGQGNEVPTPTTPSESEYETWYRKASSLIALGQQEEALVYFDKALKLNPKSFETWSNKGEALRQLGRLEEALVCLDRALALDSRWEVIWANKATVLMSLGRFEAALACCEVVLTGDPKCLRALNAKACSLKQMGQLEDALRIFDQTIQIDQRDKGGHVNKATVLWQLERFDDALKCFMSALAIDPFYQLAWDGMIEMVCSQGRFLVALALVEKRLKIAPHEEMAWWQKGLILSHPSISQLDKSLDCFEKAIKINPKSAKSWFGKGAVEETLDRKRDAYNSYQQFAKCALPEHRQEVLLAAQRCSELGRALGLNRGENQ